MFNVSWNVHTAFWLDWNLCSFDLSPFFSHIKKIALDPAGGFVVGFIAVLRRITDILF